MLLLLGDVHGEFDELSQKLGRIKISDASIIQVGDFGVGFKIHHEVKTLQNLNRILAFDNNVLYVIRGNHDDPLLLHR